MVATTQIRMEVVGAEVAPVAITNNNEGHQCIKGASTISTISRIIAKVTHMALLGVRGKLDRNRAMDSIEEVGILQEDGVLITGNNTVMYFVYYVLESKLKKAPKKGVQTVTN